jgi:glucoamylase
MTAYAGSAYPRAGRGRSKPGRACRNGRDGRMNYAPGWPGISARWTSSNKSGVGTALTAISRVWFTLSHGILNEIYYPRLDQACTRDFGLIVTADGTFFSEEKRDCHHAVEVIEDGVPAFRLFNTCLKGRYRIEKMIIVDPWRDVVIQRVRFEAFDPTVKFRLFALLSPHLVNRGAGNTGWTGEYKGEKMLFAEGAGTALALASSSSWGARSVGFVGTSDGWQDLSRHKELTQIYDRAENGNIALTGEIDLTAGSGTVVLALGFGRTADEAALRARLSLQDGFAAALDGYVAGWRDWQQQLVPLDAKVDHSVHNAYRVSTAVLRCHESVAFAGGCIASLSIPWGFAKGDDDLGGYHLVWPRDLVETAGALLAAGAHADALRLLSYLRTVQEPDGHWPQNMWLDGTPYWHGIQMDECALPILLVDLARRCGALSDNETGQYWPMVRLAAQFIVQNGPVTGQDRWEEDGGFSPFTLATEIAALLAAADLAELSNETECAVLLRETADDWNDRIEWWTYATKTALTERLGIKGYYVRIAPSDTGSAASPVKGSVPIKNRQPQDSCRPAAMIVSPDALALVRFGLRSPDDPRIADTITVVDALLKVDLPNGPCWHRYNGDGYGEHADGAPFDGTGIGRAWPLLTGERGHFELAAGRITAAQHLLTVLESFSSNGSMIPEQIWDAPDNPERELYLGKPSGSAMPLVWAHAEHIKLRRSLADGRVFDMPPQPVRRYQVDKVKPRWHGWRENNKCTRLPAGRLLRIVLREPSIVHWSEDGWTTIRDTETWDSGLGVHLCDLPTAHLPHGGRVLFTFFHLGEKRWVEVDYTVIVG